MRKLLLLTVLFFLSPVSNAQSQGPVTKENLRGLSATSDRVVWASGTHGTYIRTTDGGRSWKVAQVPGAESLDFRDVEAFSAEEAYLLAAGPGEQSRIYKTTDGGKSWALQFTNHDPKGFFDCMAFWDSDHGIAVGDPVNGKFQLIKTENGGKDWEPIPPEKLPMAIEGEGAFAASGTCIAVQGKKNLWFVTGGSAARVFRSTDAGETWGVSETPIVHGPASAGIFSVAFRDENHGVIVGGDYKEPSKDVASVATTSDGGKNWELSPIKPQRYFSAVAFENSGRRVVAVGTGQYASAGSFSDNDWQVFSPALRGCPSSHAELNALGVSRRSKGVWIVGMKGAIFFATPELKALKWCDGPLNKN
jgi:photosystem II stability/assembly factor-like uncharacterized protein